MSTATKHGMVQRADNMEIFKMQAQDVEGVYALECECFSKPWSKKSIENELYNPLSDFFVAREGQDVVGYIGTQTVLDECSITNIAVTKSFRKKGIGTKLLEIAIDCAMAKDSSFITLEVRKSNEEAISIYDKFGFDVKGIRKNFYENPCEDAYIMTKFFKEEEAI